MCLNSTLDHQCSPILFCLLCWCTILNKNTTYSIGFIINISDHVSNQRLYLKVMLRCAKIQAYHNQSVKPCIKNCLNLLIFDIVFTDALTYNDHLYLIFQNDWRHFFPVKKKCTKKYRGTESLTLCIQRALSSQCIIHCLYWFVCNTHCRSIYPL